MTRGLMYWIIVLFWVLTVVGGSFYPHPYLVPSSRVLLLVLLVLLGWDVYGPALKGK